MPLRKKAAPPETAKKKAAKKTATKPKPSKPKPKKAAKPKAAAPKKPARAKKAVPKKGEVAAPKKVAAKKPAPKKTALRRPAPRRAVPAAKRPAKKPVKVVPAAPEKIKRPPLSPEEERKFTLRKELLALRQQIMKEARTEISRYIKGENRQLVETALDDGDWSVVDLSEDINLRKLSTHRENLQKIDEALRKLEEGTYGICEECGEEISIERLKVMPFAIYCRDDQEKKEMMEALERELR
jgi:DnaK suppressor protein